MTKRLEEIGNLGPPPDTETIKTFNQQLDAYFANLTLEQAISFGQGLFGFILLIPLEQILENYIAIKAQPDKIKDSQKHNLECATGMLRNVLFEDIAESDINLMIIEYKALAKEYERKKTARTKKNG